MMNTVEKPLMAVFLDLENIVGCCLDIGLAVEFDSVFRLLEETTRPAIRYSYGDITSLPRTIRAYDIRKILQACHVDQRDVPHNGALKNSADIRLVVEALELAHQRADIKHFCVFANDRDFTPLVNSLKRLDRRVIGIGPTRGLTVQGARRVNEIYRSSFDQFHYLDEINSVKDPRQSGPTTEPSPTQPKAAATEVSTPESASTGAAPSCVTAETYRSWMSTRPLLLNLPTHDWRERIYECIRDLFSGDIEPRQLSEIKRLILEKVIGIPDGDNAVFRLLLNLYFSGAFKGTPTDRKADPMVSALVIPIERLDVCSINHVLKSFAAGDHDIAFDAETWSPVFYGDLSAKRTMQAIFDDRQRASSRSAGTKPAHPPEARAQ